MTSKIKAIFEPFFKAEKHERLKLLLLSASYAMIISVYSILKSLKNPVFFSIVGRDYQPYTRFISIPFLIIGMLFYSKLVDRLRRYQVLCFFIGVYAVLTLMFAYRLSHPVWGLSNTESSSYRLLGWAFYLALDFYQAFVVSTFWAFSNSISTPESAKWEYGLIVAFSKIGGIIAPLLSREWMYRGNTDASISAICSLVGFSSLLLIIATFLIFYLKYKIPGFYLHGYEAAYQLEKQKDQKVKPKTGVFEGIRLMISQPYVFGIFGLVYGFEAISAILEYQMNVLVSIAYDNHIIGMSSFGFVYTAAFQSLGFLFAFLGTPTLLRYLDVRLCLTILPITTIVLMGSLIIYPSLTTVFIAMVVLRAMHYGFNFPVQEILFIPTVKDIKFKAQAWIKSFGRTISKSSGSVVNIFSQGSSLTSSIAYGSTFSMGLAFIWIFIALAVGKKYTETVKEGKVIGSDV